MFLYFFQRQISEVPRPIAWNFVTWSEADKSKNSGIAAPPPKNWAKNMRNFGHFRTTSDFDREYLQD